MFSPRLCPALVFALLFLIQATVFAQPDSPRPDAAVDVRGLIVDAGFGEPIPGVNVVLRGTRRGTTTARDGRFVIVGVAPGVYHLQASCIGYEKVVRKNLQITGDPDLQLDLRMAPVVFSLREVTVTPGSFSFMETGSATRQIMSRDDIESVPQFGEDIFRAVNRLPGLSSGDFSAQFSIRGGRQDETLILIDGLEIYEPYHMKDFNEGAISIIDVETIEGVELMTGGFPVKYGNKRSGVFSIATREAKQEAARYSVGLSLMNARAMTEGSFAQGKGSWFLSARRGYLDLVFNLMNLNDLPAPVYYDVFTKVDYAINPLHKLSLDVLHAGDRFDIDDFATTGFQDTIDTRETADNSYGNSYVWTTLKSTLGSKTAVESMLSAGLVTKYRAGAEVYINVPGSSYDLATKRDFSVLGFKQDWMYEHSRSLFVEWGYDIRKLNTDYVFDSLVEQDPNDPTPDSLSYYPVETHSEVNKSGNLVGAYLSNRLQVLDPLTVELGLRYDRATHTKDSDFSPRVNTMFEVAPRSFLRLGWGHYRQIQGLQEVSALDSEDRYFSSELSKQWTAGFERASGSGSRLRLEGYFKEGTNSRPVYRYWVAGALDVFPETNEDRILVYPDKIISKGVEVYYAQSKSKKLSLSGSYAFAFVDEEINRIDNINAPDLIEFERKHANPQDQRHALNLDLTYRPSSAWSVYMSYAFHTGLPTTLAQPVEVIRADGATDVVARSETLYSSRLPSYYRLDGRVTRRFETDRGQVRLFFEVINLTNHENVFAYDYERAVDGNGNFFLAQEGETWFPLLPSIGVSWSGGF